MNKIILSIDGMSCSACSNGLEKHLNKQKGIIKANVNLVLAEALIEYDDNLSVSDIERFISDAGFTSLGPYSNKREEKKNNGKMILITFALLSILVLYISMSHMIGLPVIPFLHMLKYPINYSMALLILSLPFLVYSADIFKSGFKNLTHKTPNMDTLVSIGVLSSFIYSVFGTVMVTIGKDMYVESLYFESAAIIIFFIKLGRFIDLRSKEKTKEAIKDLVQITPVKALLKIKDKEMEVTIDEVKEGDILICKPGMKVAVDGKIVKGNAHFDEAFITGESVPIKKSIGDSVIAGSINYDGYIEYEAEKIGKNSCISEIVRLVVEATNTKAPISKLADKVSGYFVPIIMVISIITLVGHLLFKSSLDIAFTHFVTVLVVACPCALGLATPLAIVISEGMCAKNGILVKTSETLENAHKVDTIIFDKTGTLTYGNLKISMIYNYSKYTEKDIIKMVASIETGSTHPIGKAFLSYADDNKLKLDYVSDFENFSGMGLKGVIGKKEVYIGNNKIVSKLKLKNEYIKDEEELSNFGNSIVYVVENKRIIALIGIKDIVRDNAKKTIDKLKKMGKEVIMLTGDNENTAKIIANILKIDHVIANVMPKDKAEILKGFIKNGKRVMMIGDGINDAPSLVSASIGVSVSSGTDIANDSADVILMRDNLENIVSLITISKKTIKNIKQNLFWAFFYNICMIPVAIGLFSSIGIDMNPMFAGFAMTISSLTVILNALRLKKIKL